MASQNRTSVVSDIVKVTFRAKASMSEDHWKEIGDLLECELSDPDWFDEDDVVPQDWEEWLKTADEGTIGRLIDRVPSFRKRTRNDGA